MSQGADEGLVKLIVFGVIGLILLLVKVFSKKAEPQEETRQPGRPEGGGAEEISPQEALEQMFRQMQEQKKRAAAPPPAARARQAQSLDEYFGQTGQPPPAKPVPVAKPYREPTVRPRQVMRKPAPPRVILRRPKAAFATSEGPTVAADQQTLLAHSKARVAAAEALVGPEGSKAVQGREERKSMVFLAGTNFQAVDIAKGIAYLEIFGPPRSMRPYSGPPAAG